MFFRRKADFSCNILYNVLELSANRYGIKRRFSGGHVFIEYNFCLTEEPNLHFCPLMIKFKKDHNNIVARSEVLTYPHGLRNTRYPLLAEYPLASQEGPRCTEFLINTRIVKL